MKIWNAFATEHSMNLVLIGRFKEVRDAERAKQSIDRLTDFLSAEKRPQPSPTHQRHRFGEAMRQLLHDEELHSLAPEELEQFCYDVNVNQSGNEISIWTDEIETSAFLKVLVQRGARVEVYSAHDYPDGAI